MSLQSQPLSAAESMSALSLTYLRVLLFFLALASGIGLAFTVTSHSSIYAILLTGTLLVVSLIAAWLIVERWVQRVAWGVIAILLLSLWATQYPYIIIGSIVVISAAVLTGTRVFLISTAMVVLRGVQVAGTLTPDSSPQDRLMFILWVTSVATLMLIAFTTRYFIREARRSAELSQINALRMQAIADIGRQLAQSLKQSELFALAAQTMRERLALYQVNIYLLKPNTYIAHLATSTMMPLPRQEFNVFSDIPAFGQSILHNEPVVVLVNSPREWRSEWAPNVQSAIIIPVMEDQHVTGFIELQSRRVDTFIQQFSSFQILGNLLGVAMHNAKLFEQQGVNLQETRRMFEDAEINLREQQHLLQQTSQDSWSLYNQRPNSVRGVTLDGDRISQADPWTDSAIRAVQSHEIVTHEVNGQTVVSVPLLMGETVIGVMEVEASNTMLRSELQDTMESVAQRLTVSLDKARLFEESEQAARDEQRINAIVARYQNIASVDELLKYTLSELSSLLGADYGSIRLANLEEK